jgi:nitroreductase
MKCGHCVTVCPRGALSLSFMTPEQCAPVREDLSVTFEQAEHFFRSRRSVRLFQEERVEREVLLKLITASCYGATGANLQLVSWTIYTSSDDIRKLGAISIDWMKEFRETLPPCYLLTVLDRSLDLWAHGRDSVCRAAPAVLFAHAPEGGTGPQDCTIALSQLSLAAPTVGLGACWAGWAMFAAKHSPAMQEFLELPEGHICEGSMMLGYPKQEHILMPARNQPTVVWR